MTDFRPPKPFDNCDRSLVAHDIHIERRSNGKGLSRVIASVECERRGTICVEDCRECLRFARIEVHEAGYVMLCRAHEPDPVDAGAGDGPATASADEPSQEGGAQRDPPDGV